jgi:hypothetical protein
LKTELPSIAEIEARLAENAKIPLGKKKNVRQKTGVSRKGKRDE